MDIVHLLPDSVANQIAAGEVIQRPASCLKELVENSLDAGATHIQVIVRDAGRTLLQVIDNGSGMSVTDVRMAFERHATSKITTAADIFHLHTMGFRGEALASICAVAQVEVQTRRETDEVGTLLEICGSEVMRQEAVQCPVGTNMRIKNLFFNIPVRRKFLKTDATEMRNLRQEFYRIVLVYPQVQFTLVSDDEILMDLPAGTEKQRIEQVFGHGGKQLFSSQLVDLGVSTELVSIHGFLGKPESANRQPQQYQFVNGRYMRHPYFHKAIMTAYTGMLTAEQNPSYFLYFDINPESIDVNIHPTKTEIKFADEQFIFQILLAAARESLGKFNVAPSLDFDVAGRVEMPIVSASPKVSSIQAPRITTDTDYNPFHTSARPSPVPTMVQREWQPLYEDLHAAAEETTALADPYQYAQRYILLPTRAGLMIVDQHRAHACVLYDTYMREMKSHQGVMQQLLFPEVLSLTPELVAQVQALQDDLRYVGFDIEQLSPTEFTISAVPSMLSGQNAAELINNIVDDIASSSETLREQWQQRIAWTLALRTAIPSGREMNMTEMRDLLDRLWKLPIYRHTPDGKTVVTLLSEEEIGRRFH